MSPTFVIIILVIAICFIFWYFEGPKLFKTGNKKGSGVDPEVRKTVIQLSTSINEKQARAT